MVLLSAFWDFMDSLLPGLPFVILGLSIWSFYRGYMAWKSGSAGWTWIGNTPKWVETDKRQPFFSIGQVWFGIILLASAIGSFIWMQLEK